MNRTTFLSLILAVLLLTTSVSAIEFYRHDGRSSHDLRPYTPTLLLHPTPSDLHVMSLTYMHPDFVGSAQPDVSTWSGAYLFDLNLPISRNFNVELSFPFASGRSLYYHYRYDGPYTIGIGQSEIGFGNLYIGFQLQTPAMAERGVAVSFGAHLPTAEDEKTNALKTGRLADFLGYRRYLNNSWSYYANFSYSSDRKKDVIFGHEIGFDAVFVEEYVVFAPQTSQSYAGKEVVYTDEGELWAHYGFHLSTHRDPLYFRAELAGLYLLSESEASFAERFVNELALGVFLRGDMFQPGIYYARPLDDDVRDVLDDVVGFKLAMIFP